MRVVVADGAQEHGIGALHRIQHRAHGDCPLHRHRDLPLHLRQRAQVKRKFDADLVNAHFSVWTSTDSTAGRVLTMGAHVSPASAEAYTWPPVVPK